MGSSEAERDVVCWYLARREADPRASVVRPIHLGEHAEAWRRACEGEPSYVALDVPGLTPERIAAAEREVVAAWARRHASKALRDATAALDSGQDPGAVQTAVTTAMAEAASGGLVRSESHRDAAGRVLETWIHALTEAPKTIPLPWKQLQEHTGGLPLGKLVILGGRSSEHKTTTAREIAEGTARHFAAIGAGHALYWTLEDSTVDVSGRTIADNVAALTTRDLMTGTHRGRRPTADGLTTIALQVRQHLTEPWTERLRYLDEAKPRRSRMLSVLSAEAAAGCKLAVIDFLHLVRPDRGEMNPDAAHEIASDLHAAAKLHNMAILALGQLDKPGTAASSEQKRVPHATEMLYGSMLKQTAFGVIMVGRGKQEGTLDMLIEKWKSSDPNVAIRLRVDAAHDRILDPT